MEVHNLGLQAHDAYILINTMFRQLHFDVDGITAQIKEVIHGRLSFSLITPDHLRRVLSSIAEALPEDSSLPFPVSEEGILQYYQFLRPVLIAGRNGLHTVIALPVNKDHAFDIFDPVEAPVPHSNDSLAGIYELEADSLVMSKDRAKYMLLSPTEAMACQEVPVCSVRTAPYYTDTRPTCITSLFLHQPRLVAAHCTARVVTTVKFPLAKHLFGGNWVIASDDRFQLKSVCDANAEDPWKKRSVRRGITVIKMPRHCAGVSPYLEIPKFTQGDTHVAAEIRLQQEVSAKRLLPSMWKNSGRGLRRKLEPIESLGQLQDIEHLDLSNVNQKIENALNEISVEDTDEFPWIMLGSGLVLGLIVALAVVVVFILKPRFDGIASAGKDTERRVSLEMIPVNLKVDDDIDLPLPGQHIMGSLERIEEETAELAAVTTMLRDSEAI